MDKSNCTSMRSNASLANASDVSPKRASELLRDIYRGLCLRIYRFLFVSSCKKAGAFATAKGKTFQRKTWPLQRRAVPGLLGLGLPARIYCTCPSLF